MGILQSLRGGETVARRTRTLRAGAYHDTGTNDFLIGLMEEHEKMAWMLRSFLEGMRR